MRLTAPPPPPSKASPHASHGMYSGDSQSGSCSHLRLPISRSTVFQTGGTLPQRIDLVATIVAHLRSGWHARPARASRSTGRVHAADHALLPLAGSGHAVARPRAPSTRPRPVPLLCSLGGCRRGRRVAAAGLSGVGRAPAPPHRQSRRISDAAGKPAAAVRFAWSSTRARALRGKDGGVEKWVAVAIEAAAAAARRRQRRRRPAPPTGSDRGGWPAARAGGARVAASATPGGRRPRQLAGKGGRPSGRRVPQPRRGRGAGSGAPWLSAGTPATAAPGRPPRVWCARAAARTALPLWPRPPPGRSRRPLGAGGLRCGLRGV